MAATRVTTMHRSRGGRYLLGSGLAAVTVTVAILATMSSVRLGSRHSARGFGAVSAAIGPSGPGWAVKLAPAYKEADFIIGLTWDTAAPAVELLDASGSETLATIQVSTAPFVLRRQAAHELLISDTGPDGLHPRLLVFDTANRLALKRQISLPSRGAYHVYSPYGMAMSRDGRYLFYITDPSPRDLPQCKNGGTSDVCDLNAVVSIDLTSPNASAIVASLPANCGYAVLYAVEVSNVVATCTQGTDVEVLSPQGQVLRKDDFRARALFGFLLPDGRLGVVSRAGVVMLRNADGSISTKSALPDNALVDPTEQVAELTPGRLFVPYVIEGAPGRVPEGFVLFDTAGMRVEGGVSPTDGEYVVPRHSAEILILKATGIETVNLDTGTTVSLPGRLTAVPLLPGRASAGSRALVP